MSHLRPGDEDMHYCDNSHRWVGPIDMPLEVWQAQVRAHMQEHLATMGGPRTGGELCKLPLPPHVTERLRPTGLRDAS